VSDMKAYDEDYRGYTITLHYDQHGMDPHRDCDGHGVQFVFAHRRYDVPNDPGIDFDYHDSWDAIAKHLAKDYDAAVILPVYMYDHSGVALTAGSRSYPFDCKWDSGLLGLAFFTRKDMLSWKPGAKIITAKMRREAEGFIQGHVREYGQWMNGEVYGYTIEDDKGDRLDDSCWGFIGDEYAMEEAKRSVDYEIERRQSLAALENAIYSCGGVS
jgi:hypothetical protein